MSFDSPKKLRGVDLIVEPETSCRIRLDSNESCFDTQGVLREEIMRALEGVAFNRYPDPTAHGMINAFAGYYGADADMVTPGNGSDELISLILTSLFEKGDTVLTLSPDFSMYAFYGRIAELKVTSLPKDDDFKINIGKVVEQCSGSDIKAVIFSNPCNPTSLGVRRQDVLRLVKSVSCLCIVDEAYMDFWDESVIGDVKDYDNLIVLKTCSKNMGLASLRCGFAVADREITRILRAVRSPYNVNGLTQAAVTAVFAHPEMIREHTQRITDSRRALYTALYDMTDHYFDVEKVFDSVTNFVLVRSAKSRLIAQRLAERDVAVRCLGNYLRITAGTEEENEIFLKEFEDILSTI